MELAGVVLAGEFRGGRLADAQQASSEARGRCGEARESRGDSSPLTSSPSGPGG